MKLKLHITVLVLNDNAYGVRCPQYDFTEIGEMSEDISISMTCPFGCVNLLKA